MDPKKTCANCKAFSALTNECRRHPPIMVPIGQPSKDGLPAMGVFPPTREHLWCLEFEPEVTAPMQ